MKFTTLISTSDLAAHLNDPDWAIVDCRFVLLEPERGEKSYLQEHIPGAVYAHLDHDLSGKVIRGVTGRHPWPSVEKAAQLFGRLGIGPAVQVVAYDDAGGALAAARLWWMLRWLGHTAAAVLDGGWHKWVREERPLAGGEETRLLRLFTPHPRPELIVGTGSVEQARLDPSYRLIDARVSERYYGINETIDVVAGHIPGAISDPYVENLNPKGVFRAPQELRLHYQDLLGDVPPERAIFYCGSGVTSIHSLLAMLHAGLGEGRLYAGSWSEWIANRRRPVEKL